MTHTPHPLNVIQSDAPQKPWYAEGLRFKCTGCGGCCSGGPGFTWVSDDDIIAIAEYLGMDPIAFVKKYVRSVNGNLALIEISKGKGTFDCVFLEDKKCRIYPVRPTQCRTFPWWTQNLRTPEDWKEAAKRCEGISETAPVVDYPTIKEQSEIDSLLEQ